MNHIDLFTGIGGFSLSAQRVWGKEWKPILFCEKDEFCHKVLKKHWSQVPIHSDIRTLDAEKISEYTASSQRLGTQLESQSRNGRAIEATIDLLTGGFPCQPYSVAGKQKGKADDRALWPEMLRVISEAKPSWIIGENVSGFVNMGLDDCIIDLESQGYEVFPLIIPACAVDAKHRRDRVWIVANSSSLRCNTRRAEQSLQGFGPSSKTWQYVADAKKCGMERNGKPRNGIMQKDGRQTLSLRSSESERKEAWPTEPAVGRVANGIPNRVDRLKGLGNAIVPQVAMVIMQAIREIDESTRHSTKQDNENDVLVSRL